jgi:D-alanine transaminase
MLMLVYLNGQFMPAHEARISPFDRGFLFADGVYEVIRSCSRPDGLGPVCIGMQRHARRLLRSLQNLGIQAPVEAKDLSGWCQQLLTRSGLEDGLIYLQITRGTPDLSGPGPLRSHMPQGTFTPTVFGFARAVPATDWSQSQPMRKRSITAEDLRWHRCDIKSVALLGNVMASMQAHAAGVDEPILIRTDTQGRRLVSEGALTNVLVVSPSEPDTVLVPDGSVVSMLPGITREILLDESFDAGVKLRVCDVPEQTLLTAREVLLLGTTAMVTSVTELNGRPVGDGTPGPIARHLLKRLCHAILHGSHDRPG